MHVRQLTGSSSCMRVSRRMCVSQAHMLSARTSLGATLGTYVRLSARIPHGPRPPSAASPTANIWRPHPVPRRGALRTGHVLSLCIIPLFCISCCFLPASPRLLHLIHTIFTPCLPARCPIAPPSVSALSYQPATAATRTCVFAPVLLACAAGLCCWPMLLACAAAAIVFAPSSSCHHLRACVFGRLGRCHFGRCHFGLCEGDSLRRAIQTAGCGERAQRTLQRCA